LAAASRLLKSWVGRASRQSDRCLHKTPCYADEAWRQTFLASEESQRLCEVTTPDCYPRGHYRNQWWVIDPELGVLLASGIFGQSLYVNMFASVVVAILSSHTRAFDAELSADVLRACAAMSGALSIL
jgi:hypothetical protein